MASSSGGVEERIARLEEKLALVIEKLERLEELLASISAEAAVAGRLVTAFSMPATQALEAARRVLALSYTYTGDPILRAIIEALADCEPHSLSNVTRRVKSLRGTASRRIIRERLAYLAEKGVVTVEDRGNKKLYRLTVCQ